ncbi:hypothetical protein LTR78_000956 [Recurvomyces mirabilis]|uniref:MARVEL domain-containing protein n=1 Tax=Recurvomyces mirabilis TaxID=574656 RepID=A0AAE0WXG8_9PEZI|nr:hypothetical protein LTR78_000956 [Recurvomyces mirabilis]KAK5158928.1 hypothetical protein LTS14_003036 [Recurvomyces mirabilis]
MAPVIWGLDLGELQWGKFSSKYMFGNRDYHLRRTKLAVYQCALIFCVISESLGTAALSDYISIQRHVQTYFRAPTGPYPDLYFHNNDYVAAGSYNIWAGVFVAFIFGAAFFFDLIWPERYENKSVRVAWKVTGVLAVMFHLASAILLTIVTITHRSYCSGVDAATCESFVATSKKAKEAPMVYGKNGRAVAAVVFVWLGWLSVLASCILLFAGIKNTEYGLGPKSAHAEGRERAHWRANHDPNAEQDPEMAMSKKSRSSSSAPGHDTPTPAPVHAARDGTADSPYTAQATEIPTDQYTGV